MDVFPSNLHGKRFLKAGSSLIPLSRQTVQKRMKDGNNGAELSALPEDVICNITSYLSVRTLLDMRLLNHSFRSLASQESAGWGNLCDKLWSRKIHVSPAARNCPDKMAAYRMSVLDARERQFVTEEELIFNPETNEGTIWSFRFKESAGEDWTSWDPWFNGQLCRKMVFLADGSVKQAETLENPTFGRGFALSRLVDPPVTMSWRFLTRPLDMPAKPTGSYIRFKVGGRDVPTYCVRRSPTRNWGFIMESCWGVYASFELPPKQPKARRRVRLRRAQDSAGNWFNVEIEEDDDDDDDDDNFSVEGYNRMDEGINTFRNRLLIDDDSFAITSGLQWKEAFLYNFGAMELPEGDDAIAEFERTYGAALNS